jgi:hypothetical protein
MSVSCVVTQRSLRGPDHSSGGVLPTVVCLRVIVKPRYLGGPDPLGVVAPFTQTLPPASSLYCKTGRQGYTVDVCYQSPGV